MGYFGWRFLPPWFREQVSAATQPLVGTPGIEGTFTTPDPGRDAMTPAAVILMGIIGTISSLVFSIPLSWVYMFTRQKKGYSQSVVHTLLLLPVVVAMVSTLVRSNIALAFSLAGIVAAVRFRLAGRQRTRSSSLPSWLRLACGVQQSRWSCLSSRE